MASPPPTPNTSVVRGEWKNAFSQTGVDYAEHVAERVKREKEKDLCKRMEEGSANVGEWSPLRSTYAEDAEAGRSQRSL